MTGGNKSTTTGMSVFGGASDMSELPLSINDEVDQSKRESHNL